MTTNTVAKLTYPCEFTCPICGYDRVHFRSFPGTVLTGSGPSAKKSVGVRLDFEGGCGHRFFVEICENNGPMASRTVSVLGY